MKTCPTCNTNSRRVGVYVTGTQVPATWDVDDKCGKCGMCGMCGARLPMCEKDEPEYLTLYFCSEECWDTYKEVKT